MKKVGSSDGLYPEIKLSIASISDKKLSEFNRFFLLKKIHVRIKLIYKFHH